MSDFKDQVLWEQLIAVSRSGKNILLAGLDQLGVKNGIDFFERHRNNLLVAQTELSRNGGESCSVKRLHFFY